MRSVVKAPTLHHGLPTPWPTPTKDSTKAVVRDTGYLDQSDSSTTRDLFFHDFLQYFPLLLCWIGTSQQPPLSPLTESKNEASKNRGTPAQFYSKYF